MNNTKESLHPVVLAAINRYLRQRPCVASLVTKDEKEATIEREILADYIVRDLLKENT